MTSDWVTVVPEPGKVRETAAALLEAADDPTEVRTQRGGTEFLVSPQVADRYTTPKRRRSSRKGDDD